MSKKEGFGLGLIEGGSTTGKSELAKRLEKKGFVIVRGMPSQTAKDNKGLVKEGRDLMGDGALSFSELLKSDEARQGEILRKVLRVSVLQHQEAMQRCDGGDLVLMNRSFCSLAGLMDVVARIGKGQVPGIDENPRLASLAEEWARTFWENLALMRSFGVVGRVFIERARFAVLMTTPVEKKNVARPGMSGMIQLEVASINKVVRIAAKAGKFRLLEINANEMKIEEEVEMVEEFARNKGKH